MLINPPTINIPVLDNTTLALTARPVKLIVSNEGELLCEDPDARDYYGEFRGNIPWIAPELIAWADKNDGYWDWENPGVIVFTPNTTNVRFNAQ